MMPSDEKIEIELDLEECGCTWFYDEFSKEGVEECDDT
jgi:hypothetical protein